MTRGARPEKALETVVRRALHPFAGETVAIACSGGPDSVALATVAHAVAHEERIALVLAHVNHALRASADQDECVVLSVAARLGIPARIARLAGVAPDEAALRDARYAALARLARESGARAVATAHTAEDQTETVLLALFRGTGPDGLAGMPSRRALDGAIELVRPLLRVRRDELVLALRGAALPYAVDPTNADARYRRNALRAHLAALRRDFPQLDSAVARCAEIVRDERDGIPRATARRALRDQLREAAGLRDIAFADIEAALDAADAEPTGGDRTSRL